MQGLFEFSKTFSHKRMSQCITGQKRWNCLKLHTRHANSTRFQSTTWDVWFTRHGALSLISIEIEPVVFQNIAYIVSVCQILIPQLAILSNLLLYSQISRPYLYVLSFFLLFLNNMTFILILVLLWKLL